MYWVEAVSKSSRVRYKELNLTIGVFAINPRWSARGSPPGNARILALRAIDLPALWAIAAPRFAVLRFVPAAAAPFLPGAIVLPETVLMFSVCLVVPEIFSCCKL